jgi:outer membrane lipoprotein carrier protein
VTPGAYFHGAAHRKEREGWGTGTLIFPYLLGSHAREKAALRRLHFLARYSASKIENVSRNNPLLLTAWLGGVLFCLLSSKTQAQDVHQLAQAVDNHYNHLHSLQSDFTEIYRGDGPERVESGTLWLKKPRKMRWEYRSPKEKLFISDGEVVWFYMPEERQVRKTTLKKLDDLRSPLAFLLGKTKLEKELTGLSKVVDAAPMNARDTLLRGVPQGMTGQVNEVQLEITPSDQIIRIVLIEADGSETEFRFAGWKENKENVEMSDSRFQFTPPAGVETVEGELEP